MEQDSLSSRASPLALAQTTLPVLGLHVARVGLQFLWVVLLARQLGAAGYGSFSGLVGLGLVLGGLSGLGAGLRLYQDTARDPTLFSRRWHEANRALAASALPIGLVFVPLCRLWFPSVELATLVPVAVAELLLAPFVLQVANAFAAHGRLVDAAWVPVAVSSGRVLAVLALPLMPRLGELAAYAWLHCLATAGVAAACGWACRARLRPVRLAWVGPDAAGMREGLSLAAVTLTGHVLANSDKVAGLRFGGPELAGHYTAAQRFAALLCLPIDALVAASLPSLFEAGGRSEPRWRLLGTLVALALGYGVVAGLVLRLAAPALGWLLGADFVSSIALVQTFAWLVPAYALRQVGSHVLLGFGRVGWRLACEGAAALLLVALIGAWLPEFGAAGVVRAVLVVEYALLLTVWAGVMKRQPAVA